MRLAMLRSAAVAALGLVAAACGGIGAGQGTSGTAAGGASGPVWTLGAMNDLTGAGSNGGEAQQTGLNYFVDVTNRAGGVAGHRLRVQYCDTQSTPTGGAACARQLSAVDSHVVLLGGAIRPTRLSTAIGRSLLDLPLEDGRSMLWHWRDHAMELRRAIGLGMLPIRAGTLANGLKAMGSVGWVERRGWARI